MCAGEEERGGQVRIKDSKKHRKEEGWILSQVPVPRLLECHHAAMPVSKGNDREEEKL